MSYRIEYIPEKEMRRIVEEMIERDKSRKIFIVNYASLSMLNESEMKEKIFHLIHNKPHPKDLPFAFHQNQKDYHQYYASLLYDNSLYRYKFDFTGMPVDLVLEILRRTPREELNDYYTRKDFYKIMDILYPYHISHKNMTKRRMMIHIKHYKELHHRHDESPFANLIHLSPSNEIKKEEKE